MKRWVCMGLLFALGLVQAQGFEELGSFKTPSGNIYCLAYRDRLANKAELQCEVRTVTAKIPPKPKDCQLDWGQRFYLPERGAAERVCHGDTIVGNYKVLGYGQTWRVGGFSCNSSTVRLRCVNRSGRGFELSRAVQRFF
ncbi:MAG: DUF6636 domain-containing protein [Deinococcales bacterium]